MHESVFLRCSTATQIQTIHLPEAKQRTSDKRIEEQFVKPHVSFFASNSRCQLDCLLRCKGIHGCSNGSKEREFELSYIQKGPAKTDRY